MKLLPLITHRALSTSLMFTACLLLLDSTGTAAEDRPNILWISCEDISPHLGCYGDPMARTPHLDQLAAEGIRFSHAFTTAGVCAPCRSAIITGVYQTTLGTHHMRCTATLPNTIRAFPTLLREAGYYCTNNSKTDYQFRSKESAWNRNGKVDWSGRKPGQPFFSVFNFTGCHESGIASLQKYQSVTRNLAQEERQDPDRLSLPPYYPDTPVVREDWKRNYELISAMDHWAGNLLRRLDQEGLSENTIVMFWSDHGVGLPRAKRWLYDSGTHIPLIVRIPSRYQTRKTLPSGSVDNRLISSLDFGPTVLNLAGIAIPDWMQGQPFLGPDCPPNRDFVYGARDRMDERYDIIRSVRDHRFRYIRNYEPLKPYFQYMNTPEKGATMRELRRLHASDELPPAARLFMASSKPVEELYDLEEDPHEIRNLADDPKHESILRRMRAAHRQWVLETRDLGLIPESLFSELKVRAGTEYAILRQQNAEDLLQRLEQSARAASGGPDQKSTMLMALADPHPAVRYWGVTGLGNLGADALKEAPHLEDALRDSSPSVQVAAARGLLRMNSPSLALPVLEKALVADDGWLRLQAAIALDEANETARSLIPAMRNALVDQPNKYIVRVVNRALNELLDTNNTVP